MRELLSPLPLSFSPLLPPREQPSAPPLSLLRFPSSSFLRWQSKRRATTSTVLRHQARASKPPLAAPPPMPSCHRFRHTFPRTGHRCKPRNRLKVVSPPHLQHLRLRRCPQPPLHLQCLVTPRVAHL